MLVSEAECEQWAHRELNQLKEKMTLENMLTGRSSIPRNMTICSSSHAESSPNLTQRYLVLYLPQQPLPVCLGI